METKLDAFTIRVPVGDRDYRLDIIKGCDGKDLPSYFTVCEGPVPLAVIHFTSTGNWEWVEGGFMQQDASYIGNAIKEHLS